MKTGLRLPWLGNVETNELGLIFVVLLFCCLIAALVGHLMGCSDPTAPTQYPFWPLFPGPKDDVQEEQPPPAKKNEQPRRNMKAIESKEEGDLSSDEKKKNFAAELPRPTKRTSSGGFGRTGPAPNSDGPKVKVDAQKKAEEARKWAEKRKAAQEKASTNAAGFGRSPSIKPTSLPKKPLRKEESDDENDLENLTNGSAL